MTRRSGSLPGAAVFLAALGAAAPAARAQTAIEGRIRDGTSGAPGRAERVSLLRLAGGMSQVASLESVEGSFRFDLDGPGPYLVQAVHRGVTYNQPVPPMERGTATVEVTVYETTTDLAGLKVTVPHWIVIVDGPTLHVSRIFEIHNRTDPPRAIVGDPGAFRFDLPEEATLKSATVTSARMPLRQEPFDTRDGRGKTIAYAIKPGMTRLEVEHELAYPGRIEIRETLHHGAESLQLIVLPAEVEAEASGLEARGRMERQGVSFLTFTGRDLEPGQVVSLKLRGEAVAPHAPGPETAAEGDAAAGESPGLGGEIKEVSNRIGRGWVPVGVLGGILGALGAALAAALRRPAPAAPAAARRRSSPRAESLLGEIARLDDRLAAGELGEDDHAARRAGLKRALLDELAMTRRRKRSA